MFLQISLSYIPCFTKIVFKLQDRHMHCILMSVIIKQFCLRNLKCWASGRICMGHNYRLKVIPTYKFADTSRMHDSISKKLVYTRGMTYYYPIYWGRSGNNSYNLSEALNNQKLVHHWGHVASATNLNKCYLATSVR